MRLTPLERTEITKSIAARDPLAVIYLFGSRIDDTARGGDLDILVLSKAINLSHKLDILADLHSTLGDQKIDLVVFPDLSRPFARIAVREGIRL